MINNTDEIFNVDVEIEKHQMDIGYMIKILNDTLEKRANEDLRHLGLTFAQLRTIHFIATRKNQQTTQKELEDFFNVSHPTINGILKRLEEKGKIKTELAVNKRLTKIVRITKEGLEDCRNSETERLRNENILGKYLSTGEKETLMSLLRKVQQGLSEEEQK